MLKVVFLFNHDHNLTHHVLHAAPYAFELSRQYPDIEVTIACSSRQMMEFIKHLEPLYPNHTCNFQILSVPWLATIRTQFLYKMRPVRARSVLKKNLDFLRGFDALVAPERQSLILRTHLGLKNLTLIHTGHGSGDRVLKNFDDRSRAFDLTLLPGQKYVDRLKGLNSLEEGKYAVVGYPKFDVVKKLNEQKKTFFPNSNPTVVYNPHFSKKVSSWEPMGIDILEFFKNHPNWNLIFAPHVELFKGRGRNRHDVFLPKKYKKIRNIYIDTGSDASMDMTYTLAADIYLGDASSQIYEFLLKKRPCIFLNGHGVNWQNNPYYLHWSSGQVVNDINQELKPALEQAFTTHKQFLNIQQEVFDYTFYNETESTATERGAEAIAKFLS